MDQLPVIMVGAGPVGLTLACVLRRNWAIDCRIIDAGEGPTPPEESRALGIHARTMELLHQLGLAGEIARRGRRIRGVNVYDRGRKFAGFETDFSGLHTRFPYILSFSQGELEHCLVDLLGELGGQVEWGTKLIGLRQDSGGVAAEIAVAGRQSEEVRAAWLVGCDGAHSTVRHELGLRFEGAAYEEHFLLADARIRWDLDAEHFQVMLVDGGLMPAIPLPGEGLWRLIDATGGTRAETPEAIAERFRELLEQCGFPRDAMERPMWASAFRIHRRATDRLRVGHCFLAGDAAHIHSPVGGQGMNTGMQDAWNLAWKLAAVIQRRAASTLLDFYEAERLPIARGVLANTDRATRIATLRRPLARALRNNVARFGGRVGAVRRAITRRVSQLDVGYRDSAIVHEHDELKHPWSGPRPGDRAPDVELNGPSGTRRLHDLFEGGVCHTLLIFGGEESRTARAESLNELQDELRELHAELMNVFLILRAAGTDETARRVIYDSEGEIHRVFGADRPCLYLIRPDGCIAARQAPPESELLERYLRSTSQAPPVTSR